MSGIASFSSPADACDPAAAAVKRAVALIRVVGRLTRIVFALGTSVKQRVETARSEGREATIPGRSVTLGGVIALVRQALLVADALRWRLATPAVRLAMRRERKAAVAADGQTAPEPTRERRSGRALPPDMRDPMAQLLERRRHPEAQASMRAMLSTMTDAEALNMIFSYLLTAAEMLSDVEATESVEAVVAHAVTLFEGEDAAAVVPRVRGAVAPTEPAAAAPVPEGVASAPDAVERGPPLA